MEKNWGDTPSATLNLYKLFILQSPGKKDLVIDGDLMKPLDRIASVSLLKVCD